MSLLEGDEHEEPEFKWLKEIEGKRDGYTRFYESFLYDGVEYSLYDSVYLEGDSPQHSYIGKLVLIWEEADKSKKIKVQWFFRPSEILYYLGDTEVLDNELFLASGSGIGLVNTTPLESLIGKCNVICTSIDERNPKIPENKEKMAEYVFYRTFDVQSCKILNQFNDTVGELPVEFVFNGKESLRTLSSPKLDSNNHDARNDIVIEGITRLLSSSSPNINPQPKVDCNHMVGNDDTNANQVNIVKEELPDDVDNGSLIRETTSRGKYSNVGVDSSNGKNAACAIANRSASSGKIGGCTINAEDKVKERKSSLKHVEKNVKASMKLREQDDNLTGGMLDDISSKDSGKDIALTFSKERQALSTIKNESTSGDKIDRPQSNNKKYIRPPLKNACSMEKVQPNSIALASNDLSVKRGKLDSSSRDDRETISNKGNKTVAYVKNDACKVNLEEKRVEEKKIPSKHASSEERIKNDTHGRADDASLKREKHDKLSKDNGRTCMPTSIISRNSSKTKINCASSLDAKSISFDKDLGGLRQDTNPTTSSTSSTERMPDVRTSSRKTLEPGDVAGFVSNRNDLKSSKCWNASTEKSSRINDMLVDEPLKNKSNDVFERHGHESFKRKDLSSTEGLCFGDVPGKKVKLHDHNEPCKESNVEVIRKMKEASCEIGQEMTNHVRGVSERKDLTFAKDSCVKGLSKKAKLDCSSESSKVYKNDVLQTPKEKSHDKKNGKVEGEIFEVSQRPISEKRTWLKLEKLCWESMKTAHSEGKLVLLQNLDPTLTSAEVKDIIWHAFGEKCMVKMVQHTAISSPHNGQALLIFDTREVAERVLKELNDKCLMVLERSCRPLVGCTVVLPEYPRMQTFVGHLSIDKVRRLLQRDMKEAVSTSHYSQPNTIEYEMAMEWLLLQSKSSICCQNLFEQHKVELRKLVSKLCVE